MDLQNRITDLLTDTIEASRWAGILKELPFLSLDVPKNRDFGDYCTNVAMQLGQKTQESPLEVAGEIEKALKERVKQAAWAEKIERIEAKPPGFINFFLSADCLYDVLVEIERKKENYGRANTGRGQKVHIEFVSANPTGPLNVAHGRQAAFGDTLANLFDFLGYKVTREYYLNDEGVQIDILGECTRVKYLGLLGESVPFPEDGYKGKYIDELAGELKEKYADQLCGAKNSRNREFFSEYACEQILKQIKSDLADFGVTYDSWFSQKKLSRSGKISQVLEFLKKEGFIYQKEGAWWLATSRFGDDKDRVVIKSDGNLTYIAPDIAYHQSKFKRGFTTLLNIWGPDHHGYIARIKAAVSALGYDAQRLNILIVQLVSLAKADTIIPMSTRQGQYISLAEIIQAVGKDAARFFFLMRKRDSHLQFDLELAKKQSLENPVYYIQYAHARSANIIRTAEKNLGAQACWQGADLTLLDKDEEIALIQTLRMFPAILESCLNAREPHRITVYLQDLARDFHHYYEKHRVVSADQALTAARLFLINAIKLVLNNGLRLLAVSAPEKM